MPDPTTALTWLSKHYVEITPLTYIRREDVQDFWKGKRGKRYSVEQISKQFKKEMK